MVELRDRVLLPLDWTTKEKADSKDGVIHILIQNAVVRSINDLEVEQNERCVAQPFVGKEFYRCCTRKTEEKEKGRMVMKTGTCLKTLERLQADDSRGHARGCGGRGGGRTIWTHSMSAKDAKKR